MIKIVFFDIDGTLIPFNENRLPDSTRRSIFALREKGIKVFIATGKDLATLSKMPVMKVPFDGYLTLNGQLCYNEEMQLLFGRNIDPGEMEVMAQIFKANRIPFSMVGEFSKYINFLNETAVSNYIKTNSAIPDVDKYHGEKIYQITAFVSERQRELLDRTFDYSKTTQWAKGAIDIIHKDGGKMSAIRYIVEKYGFKPEECMAFGDGENDRDMIRYCGIGVAMGNAIDELKANADYVTDDVDKDGIEKALFHFGLIE